MLVESVLKDELYGSGVRDAEARFGAVRRAAEVINGATEWHVFMDVSRIDGDEGDAGECGRFGSVLCMAAAGVIVVCEVDDAGCIGAEDGLVALSALWDRACVTWL